MLDSINMMIAEPIFYRILIVSLITIIIFYAANILKRSLVKYIMEKDAWYKTRKIINIIVYLIVILLIMFVFSDSLSELSVILGVTGAGIAFALQEVIISIAGWIAVITGRIYRTGDRIQLGGIKGDVIDLSVLRTTIMEMADWVDADLYNGKIVRVANSFVFKQPVYNYSSDFPFLWDEIKIPIKFSSDHELTREILYVAAEKVVGDFGRNAGKKWREMVRKYLIEDASTLPIVTVLINDNWAEYTLRYVVEYRKRRSTQDKLFMNILLSIQKSKGQVQLASETVQLEVVPPVNVHLSRDKLESHGTNDQ